MARAKGHRSGCNCPPCKHDRQKHGTHHKSKRKTPARTASGKFRKKR